MSVLGTIIDLAKKIDRNPEVNVNMPSATEGELRMAQANAARPVSEGGLGLGPDNTREERAFAMGYLTPAFHGGYRNIREFQPSNTGIFFAKDPRVAGTYAGDSSEAVDFIPQEFGLTPVMLNRIDGASIDAQGHYFGDIPLDGINVNVGGSTVPLREFAQKAGSNDDGIMTDDIVRASGQAPSVEFKNIVDLGPVYDQAGEINRAIPDNLDDDDFFTMVEEVGSDVYAMKRPSDIRSPLAAFDPMRRNSRDITAGVGGMGVLGLLPQEAEASSLTPEQRAGLYPEQPSFGGMLVDNFAEAGSALGEGIVGGVDFLTADIPNFVLDAIGSDIPRAMPLRDIPVVQEYTEGGYMEDGTARDIIRSGFGLLSPI